MTAAPEVTATDVTIFTARNVTASRCGHRTFRTLRTPVIGQRSADQRRAGPALRRFGRHGI